jgi:small subunit ribosomal protein S1
MNSSQSPETNLSFSMDDFASALENFDYQFQKGQVVVGKPLSYESDGAFVDIGAKSPAFLPTEEASLRRVADLSAILPLDEEREFMILREQNADGQITLSLREFEIKRAWEQLTELREANQSLQVRVSGVNKGGVTVDVQGLRGFIPRSHLVERENLEALKGQTLSATVLDLDPERNKLVLSNRLAARSVSFSQLEVGQLIEGKVASIKPFGVFIEFDGTTGLLHINQISKNFIESLPALFQVGQVVKAMIADLDEGKGRVSLTTKALENYPGEMIEKPADVMAEADDRYGRARKVLMGE